MFDNIKNMAGIAGLLKDLPRIKAKLDEVKGLLGEMTAEGEAGGGAVRVAANGLLQVTSIHLEAVQLDEDRAAAQDLIGEAVNDALRNARTMAEQEFAKAARELGLPFPAGGLAGLMG